MTTSTPTDQVRIERDDELVRCGPALFTLFHSELEVRFMQVEGDTKVRYDLKSVPFNTACLLYDGRGRTTPFLVCNQWGTLYVRYGEIPAGKQLPALRAKQYPRETRLVDDVLRSPHAPSCAMHPNSDLGLCVKLAGDTISMEIYDTGVAAYRLELKVKQLHLGQWYTPRDRHGKAWPVRLRRPVLAGLFKVRVVDVQWVV